jgi:hypothetical protein
VTSGRQSEALIAAAQGRLSNAAELIEDAVQEVIEQYIELCAQFYTTERVARITGKDVSFSRDALLKRVETEYQTGNVMQDPVTGEDAPETQKVVEEYVPKFDVKVNIGVEKPRDREYYIQTAFNLLQTIDPATGMPMIDAAAVKYTVENGRMEPMSVIEERMNVEAQQLQQLQQLQMENQQLQQQVQEMGGALQQEQQNNISAQNEAAKMDQDMKKQQFDQQMASEKMKLEKVKTLGQIVNAGQS